MKPTKVLLKYLLLITFFPLSFFSYAIDSTALEEQANVTINQLYHRLNSMPNISMAERIDWISKYFLGTTYELGALGEGAHARYDQYPQYRVDAFDCDTFVNTVLSLALADSIESFKHCQKLNRYKEGKVAYINRNHFTSLDWDMNNQKRNVLKDITFDIKDQKHRAVYLYATALVDKPAWYLHKDLSTIRVHDADKRKQQELLDQLKKKGAHLEAAIEKTPYVPFTALFTKENQPDLYLFSQIPHGAIIQIIRPNWDLRQTIGTSLNVSHLGFAIRNKGQLYFREASSQLGKVVDVPLIDYLKNAQNSRTIKGINVQIVLTQKPSSALCKI